MVFCRGKILRAKRDLGKSCLCRRRRAAIIEVDLKAIEVDLFGVDAPFAVGFFRRLCWRGGRRLGLCDAREIDDAAGVALDVAVAFFAFERSDDNGFFSDIDGNILQRQRRDAPKRLRLPGELKPQRAQVCAQTRQIDFRLLALLLEAVLRR